MVGSLLEVGLKLKLSEAYAAIRNVEFVALSVLWAFVICPALALLLTKIIPLAEPYAVGLILLGMTPAAPFFPMMAGRAGGDFAYAAAFMLIAYFGTVFFMPVATPFLLPTFKADAWTIAKPLMIYITAPLAAGVLIRAHAEALASRMHPVVKKVTAADALIMLALVLWIYGAEFLNAVGTFAIGSQLLFYTIVAIATYASAVRLPNSQRNILTLGLCTRNVGATFAPLVAVPGTDARAIAMVALAVPLTVACALLFATVLTRFSSKSDKLIMHQVAP